MVIAMKKLALFLISVLMIMGISAFADTASQYVFDDYDAVGEVYPGRLFHTYTKTAPEITEHNGVNCLKIDSGDNADNIVLMNSNSFTDGGFSVEFSLTADSAPRVNWGKAPHIIIRYIDADGKWVNDTIAEYAYDLIRVKDDGKEVKATSFIADGFNDFKFAFTRKENIFKAVYQIGGNEYTKEYNTCDGGEICVGFFSYLGNALYLKNIKFEETYSRCPSAQEIKADLLEKNPSHPRILMDGDRLDKIRILLQSSESFKMWYANVKAKADAALIVPVSKYELRDGERLLYVSRDVYANTVYPAFVYLIEGGDEYINRVWSELSAAAEFPDWHPTHFLDTAEMTLAFAICYDWLYDYWDEEQRGILQTAIEELGLDAAMEAYNNEAEYDNSIYGAYHNRIGWKNDPSNWGLVCNGGIAAGALAIMNESDIDYCAEILEDAMNGLEAPLSMYAPDGAWLEGVGYWHYATQYLTYMMSSLENTVGSTYGYMDSEGIRQSANYLIAHTGAKGTFNYGDCTESVISAPELFYLSDYYGDGSINAARLGMMERFGIDGGIDDILFYNPDIETAEGEFKNSAKFDSVGVVTATNSAVSDMASYIAMKAGKIGVSHGDLDAGSFVIDALGVRWASDYGSDSYTLPGYFDWASRINYYRKRAEGHSTLVINPDSEADQKLGATAPITNFISGDNGMVAVTDMSEIYADDAQSVTRAVSLFDDSTKFMVQDEIKSDTPCDVYWFMQTKQSVSFGADRKTITLSSGNKRMLMVLQSNSDLARFSVTPAKPLGTSPNPEGQSTNSGYFRICVACEDVTDLELRVVFIPYIAGFEPDISELEPISAIDEILIDMDKEKYAKPDAVYINGKPLEGFCKQLYHYKLEADGNMPVIEAMSDKYDISVRYGTVAEVTVSDPEGILKDGKYYFIVSGTADDSIRAEATDKEVKVFTYNRMADIYIADYNEDGRLKEVRFFDNAKNTVKTDMDTSDIRVFAWDDMHPLESVISFTN